MPPGMRLPKPTGQAWRQLINPAIVRETAIDALNECSDPTLENDPQVPSRRFALPLVKVLTSLTLVMTQS